MYHMVDQAADVTPRESLLMRGVLDMCVLALLDREPVHAYGLVQALQTYGFTNASYGTIYPLVTRLKKQGLVAQQLEVSPAGPARNVLDINDDGRAALQAWSQQWRQTTEIVSSVLTTDRQTQRIDVHVG